MSDLPPDLNTPNGAGVTLSKRSFLLLLGLVLLLLLVNVFVIGLALGGGGLGRSEAPMAQQDTPDRPNLRPPVDGIDRSRPGAWFDNPDARRRFEEWRRSARNGVEGEFRQLIESLPNADRRVIREVVVQSRERFGAPRAEMRSAIERVQAVLAAPDFDPTELDAALQEVRDASDRMWDVSNEIIIGAVTDLSPEGRRVLARFALMQQNRGGPPRDNR